MLSRRTQRSFPATNIGHLASAPKITPLPFSFTVLPTTTEPDPPCYRVPGFSADNLPQSLSEEVSRRASRPLTRHPPPVPSRLISAAVGRVQPSGALCPAISTFVLNSEPYEAPRTRMLKVMWGVSNSALLASLGDFRIRQSYDRPEHLIGMFAEQGGANDFGRR